MQDIYVYLPIIVGVLAFLFTLYLRTKAAKQPTTQLSASPSAQIAKQSQPETKSPGTEAPVPKYGPIHFFFGSQTGTAQNYSKQLAEEAAKAGFEPNVVDLGDFHPEFFKDVKIALFLLATHGEGEPTDNAKKFNEYIISSERNGTEFKGLKFGVFALGNKQYQFYCAQGRRANEYLEKHGGQRVYKYGEGDDNESLEDDFNHWKEGIWTEIVKFVEVCAPSESAKTETTTGKPKSNLPFVVNISSELREIDLEHYDSSNDDKEYDFQAKQYLSSSNAPLTLIRELRQKTHDGSTLHVEIDCAAAGLTYKTAQNLGIYAENDPEVVKKAANLLGLNLKDVFVIEKNSEVEGRGKFKHPIPSPISVETYLARFCDLQGPLRKKQLKDLAPFSENEDARNKLLFLASNEGKTEYEVQIQSGMKGLLDLIEEYNLKISLDNLIQIANPIMPRLYTIASSNKKHPNTVHLCVSIHSDALPNGKNKMGLTSGFLIRRQNQLAEGKSLGKVRINIRDSTFLLPTDANVPIVMVGPGAGLAPFKGFIDEKAHLLQTGAENPYGEMTLYFGCKGREWDHLYREELDRYHSEGLLKECHVAFSREQGHKVYVQDLILRHKDQISRLLFERNAAFYMCGSMAMGKSVMGKLAEIASDYYSIELAEAQKKVEELEKNKRIIKELWG